MLMTEREALAYFEQHLLRLHEEMEKFANRVALAAKSPEERRFIESRVRAYSDRFLEAITPEALLDSLRERLRVASDTKQIARDV